MVAERQMREAPRLHRSAPECSVQRAEAGDSSVAASEVVLPQPGGSSVLAWKVELPMLLLPMDPAFRLHSICCRIDLL